MRRGRRTYDGENDENNLLTPLGLVVHKSGLERGKHAGGPDLEDDDNVIDLSEEEIEKIKGIEKKNSETN